MQQLRTYTLVGITALVWALVSAIWQGHVFTSDAPAAVAFTAVIVFVIIGAILLADVIRQVAALIREDARREAKELAEQQIRVEAQKVNTGLADA